MKCIHAIHKSKDFPEFVSASMLAAYLFCRDDGPYYIQMNLTHSSAEYHWCNISSVPKS